MLSKLVVPGPVEDVDEMRVLEWHGEVGRQFSEGELVVELETHKAVVEVRATRHGYLRRILCEPGAWQRVGMPLAVFGDAMSTPIPADADVDALGDWIVAFEVT
jgi:pyruvate/2-oxoglutarate dehydrogenase complex dihydrolipoamide acyltransferase (E2) component